MLHIFKQNENSGAFSLSQKAAKSFFLLAAFILGQKQAANFVTNASRNK
jgi:hypothetical protein